jgi:type IV pilus assembly protein PilY1
VFNGREVFLSSGWYRAEYLRWIFYNATSAQLASLPGVTRLQAVKDVVTNLIQSNPTISFGISTFNGNSLNSGNHSGNLYNQWNAPAGTTTSGSYPKIRSTIGTSQTTLINSLNAIGAWNGTPLANTYIEALRYLYGSTARDPYYSSTYTYTSPITGQCDAHSIILLTDGLPTAETHNRLPNNNWVSNLDGTPNGATNNNNCQNVSDTLCASFAPDAAWYGYHTDFKSTVAGVQNITTYTVGLGIDYSLLTSIAVDGGTGQSYVVNTATDISDTLQSILNGILQTPTNGAGVATLDKLYGETKVYQPTFFADTWTGSVNVFNYDDATNSLNFDYDMGQVLESRDLTTSPRTIIAGLDTDHDGYTNTSIAFTTTNAATLRTELFQFFISGSLSSSLLASPISAYTTTAAASTLISYIQGNAVTNMRVRDRDNDGLVDRLGDIVYSRPVEVGARNGNYNSMTGYTSFVSGLQSQPALLLVGSNDGMLHAFDSLTGAEKWAYIPSSQLPYLERIGRMNYATQSRRSFVDGQISVEDVYRGGAWRTYAMFGLRTGGSQYVVLDITNRNSPSLVWEVNAQASGGQSWSKPVIVPANGPTTGANPALFTWYMVVGTGEGKTTTGTNLIAYDLASTSAPTGTTISISASDPSGTRTSSVATSQNDSDFNVDRLYVGSEEGDMFRVRVIGAPSTWTVQKVYDGNNTQPIVAAPSIVLADNPQYSGAGSGIGSMALATGIYWGTGKYDLTADIAAYGTVSQGIFGLFDPVDTSADAYANVLSTQALLNLQDQSTTGFSVRKLTSGKYTIPTGKSGFRIPLGTSVNLATGNYLDPVGEVVQPSLNVRGIVLFSTFLPETGACSIGGWGFLQGVHFQTGGGSVVDYYKDPSRPFYNGGIPDINTDGSYNSTDLSAGFTANTILPALDTHVESVDLTNDIVPYEHDGSLEQNDVRLHSSNGGIKPAVSSLGHTGLPSSPSLLASSQNIVVQPAYPGDPGSTNPPPDPGEGEEGGAPANNGMPPPELTPINLYNLLMKLLSFHESTGD